MPIFTYFFTEDKTVPYWLSRNYRRALLIDALKQIFHGIKVLPEWRKTKYSFIEGLRLLRRYMQNRIQRWHLVKRETIWGLLQDKSPQTIVEIGSYDGLDALEFSRMFPSARVFAFEADPENYKLVEKNVFLHKKVTPIHKAVFNFTGQGVFHVSGKKGEGTDTRSSGSMLSPLPKFLNMFRSIAFETEIYVETTTLYDWAKTNQIETIDVLWMDVQGAELQILEGMEDLLLKTRIICLEVWQDPYYEGGVRLNELQDFLIGHGFEQCSIWMDGEMGDALFQNTRKDSF